MEIEAYYYVTRLLSDWFVTSHLVGLKDYAPSVVAEISSLIVDHVEVVRLE